MLNLEKRDRIIIVFLTGTLLAGIGMNAYQKSHSSPYVGVDHFDIEQKITEGESGVREQRVIKININEADSDELMRLPGVGSVLAQRIIDQRSSQGPFRSIDEIKAVKGIGEKLFEKIKDDITIE